MKIFAIGLHKTGTYSLSHALKELGYRPQHGSVNHSEEIKRCMLNGGKGLETIEAKHGEKDAYLDIYAIRDYFCWFDQKYDAKFILTTRDEDEWVQSVYRQIEKRDDTPFFHHYYYETEFQWRRFKRYHETIVLNYFAGRNNLLTMNVKDGWEPLCKFLDKPVPNKPFPHKNKSNEK